MTPEIPIDPVIVADDQVVRSWKQAAGRSLHAAARPLDPAVREALAAGASRDVAELVAYLADALAHAAGILLASVANARPGAALDMVDGLQALVDEVTAAQACPIPDPGGAQYRCRCTGDGRRACAEVAFDVGVGRITPAGDDGCEGGAA
jgi:hypothetical protein